jgi:hypothetical protein
VQTSDDFDSDFFVLIINFYTRFKRNKNDAYFGRKIWHLLFFSEEKIMTRFF